MTIRTRREDPTHVGGGGLTNLDVNRQDRSMISELRVSAVTMTSARALVDSDRH